MGIGGLIGITGGSHSSSSVVTPTTTNSNNVTETGSHNTDQSINSGDASDVTVTRDSNNRTSSQSITGVGAGATVSVLDGGAISLASDANDRFSKIASQALALLGGKDAYGLPVAGTTPGPGSGRTVVQSGDAGAAAAPSASRTWLLIGAAVLGVGGLAFALRRKK